MLQPGSQAPDFTGTNRDGKTITLSLFRGKKVVLFFFPKAFTSGCTLETRMLRDRYEEFSHLGAEVIGVSTDDLETQCAFATQERVSFPMVADPQKEIGTKYDVIWPILGINQRITYLIDEQGVIRAVFHHEVRIQKHIEEIHNQLQRMQPVKVAATQD